MRRQGATRRQGMCRHNALSGGPGSSPMCRHNASSVSAPNVRPKLPMPCKKIYNMHILIIYSQSSKIRLDQASDRLGHCGTVPLVGFDLFGFSG